MKNSIFFIALFLSTSTSILAGGPWPQKKDNGFFKLSAWWTIFDQHFTDLGKIDPNVTNGIVNTTLYAEYGLTDKLTTVINLPLLSRNYMNNLRSNTTNEILVKGESVNSLGDLDLGLKYGLTKAGSKIPIAVSLILGLPTGKSSAGTQNNLQTGDGEFNQMIQIDAGSGFVIGKKLPAYYSGYIGFNNRSQNFSEEFRYGAEFGIGLIDSKLWINTKLNVVESLKNGALAAAINSTSVFANNTEYTSIGIEANVYLTPKIGVSVSTAGALRGEVIAAAPSYSIGVFYDMK